MVHESATSGSPGPQPPRRTPRRRCRWARRRAIGAVLFTLLFIRGNGPAVREGASTCLAEHMPRCDSVLEGLRVLHWGAAHRRGDAGGPARGAGGPGEGPGGGQALTRRRARVGAVAAHAARCERLSMCKVPVGSGTGLWPVQLFPTPKGGRLCRTRC
jgi:hypothetical protein